MLFRSRHLRSTIRRAGKHSSACRLAASWARETSPTTEHDRQPQALLPAPPSPKTSAAPHPPGNSPKSRSSAYQHANPGGTRQRTPAPQSPVEKHRRTAAAHRTSTHAPPVNRSSCRNRTASAAQLPRRTSIPPRSAPLRRPQKTTPPRRSGEGFSYRVEALSEAAIRTARGTPHRCLTRRLPPGT